jgi:hypothetical protein
VTGGEDPGPDHLLPGKEPAVVIETISGQMITGEMGAVVMVTAVAGEMQIVIVTT